MAFTGNGTRLVGDDALVARGTFGIVFNGDGVTALPTHVYLVIDVASPSGFPAPAEGGDPVAVGDFLQVTDADNIVPNVGDNLVKVDLEDLCDVSSWEMPFTKEEIDVTTLCDVIKKYRAGKADMAGTIKGVFTVGLTDDPDGFLRQFIRIARQDGDVSFDSFSQRDSIMLGFFYLNKDTDLADLMLVIAPVILFTEKVGANLGEAQAFDGTFRFSTLHYTDDTHDVEINPTFYRWGTNEAGT